MSDGTLDSALFKDKVVLIGITDPGLAPAYRVGIHNRVAMVEIMADTVARILSTVRLSRPSWALPVEVVVLVYFAFFLIFFLMLPFIFLSGFFYPLEAMPRVLQWISYLIPLRYLLVIVRGIILKGAGLSILWEQVLALLLFASATLALAASRFRKRL